MESELQTAVRQRMEHLRLSQVEAARQIGTNNSYLSRWFSGKLESQYIDDLTAKCARWLSATSQTPAPSAQPTVPTKAGDEMLSLLALCESTMPLVCLCGPAGAGKSHMAREYLAGAAGRVSLLQVRTGSRMDWEMARALRSLYGKRGSSTEKQTIWETICDGLRGTGCLLVVDDAHRLTRGALRLLLDVHAETGLRLAFIGREGLDATLREAGLTAIPSIRVDAKWSKKETRALVAAAVALPEDKAALTATLETARELLHQAGGLHNLAAALRLHAVTHPDASELAQHALLGAAGWLNLQKPPTLSALPAPAEMPMLN